MSETCNSLNIVQIFEDNNTVHRTLQYSTIHYIAHLAYCWLVAYQEPSWHMIGRDGLHTMIDGIRSSLGETSPCIDPVRTLALGYLYKGWEGLKLVTDIWLQTFYSPVLDTSVRSRGFEWRGLETGQKTGVEVSMINYFCYEETIWSALTVHQTSQHWGGQDSLIGVLYAMYLVVETSLIRFVFEMGAWGLSPHNCHPDIQTRKLPSSITSHRGL